MTRTLRQIAAEGDERHMVFDRQPIIPNPWIRFAISAALFPVSALAWVALLDQWVDYGVVRLAAQSLLGYGIPATQLIGGSLWTLHALARSAGGWSQVKIRHWLLIPSYQLLVILVVLLVWTVHDWSKYGMS